MSVFFKSHKPGINPGTVRFPNSNIIWQPRYARFSGAVGSWNDRKLDKSELRKRQKKQKRKEKAQSEKLKEISEFRNKLRKPDLFPYVLSLMYNGSRYQGNSWINSESNTITNRLVNSLDEILDRRHNPNHYLPLTSDAYQIKWTSRTDTGVHSMHNLITCFLPLSHHAFLESDHINKMTLLTELNESLPFDIQVSSVHSTSLAQCNRLVRTPRDMTYSRKYYYLCPSFLFSSPFRLNCAPHLDGNAQRNAYWSEEYHLNTDAWREACMRYRISDEEISELNDLFYRFVCDGNQNNDGIHFHNFTKAQTCLDSSLKKWMKRVNKMKKFTKHNSEDDMDLKQQQSTNDDGGSRLTTAFGLTDLSKRKIYSFKVDSVFTDEDVRDVLYENLEEQEETGGAYSSSESKMMKENIWPPDFMFAPNNNNECDQQKKTMKEGMQWIKIEIEGNAFLYHEIRKIMGYVFCLMKNLLISPKNQSLDAFKYGFIHPYFTLNKPLDIVPEQGLILSHTQLNIPNGEGELRDVICCLNQAGEPSLQRNDKDGSSDQHFSLLFENEEEDGDDQNELAPIVNGKQSITLHDQSIKQFQQLLEASIIRDEIENRIFESFVGRMHRKHYMSELLPHLAAIRHEKESSLLENKIDDLNDDCALLSYLNSEESQSLMMNNEVDGSMKLLNEIKPVLSDVRSVLMDSPLFAVAKSESEGASKRLLNAKQTILDYCSVPWIPSDLIKDDSIEIIECGMTSSSDDRRSSEQRTRDLLTQSARLMDSESEGEEEAETEEDESVVKKARNSRNAGLTIYHDSVNQRWELIRPSDIDGWLDWSQFRHHHHSAQSSPKQQSTNKNNSQTRTFQQTSDNEEDHNNNLDILAKIESLGS